MIAKSSHPVPRFALSLLGALFLVGSVTSSQAWWNKEWTARKSFTIDTTAEGGAITDPIGDSVVLIRLHQGNFQFGIGKDDGSDIRFVSADDKTVLPSHVEKYDGLMNEAFVWVKVPEVKPGAKNTFYLYYGNPGDETPKAEAKATYGDNDFLVYHFAEQGSPARDSSARGNNAETAGSASQGSMIGSGLRLLGKAISIPAGESESFNWNDGGALTWSAWVKPSNLAANAVIFSRKEGGSGFQIGLDQGVPYVEVTNGAGTQRSAPGAPLAASSWKQLTVVSEGSSITLYVDGEQYSKLSAALPALTGPAYLGGTSPDGPIGFVGEIDELQIAQVARPAGAIKLAAISQSGSDKAAKLLAAGEDEASEGGGHNEIMEHLSLFGEISKSLTFDGWAVIGLCSIMAVIGWYVAVRKFFRLNQIKKGNEVFLQQWHSVSNDLTKIDHTDADNVKSLGGASAANQSLMKQSPVYHIYHIGSEEIRHRITGEKKKDGLSSRSIQAIRASLDGGLVRETQRLNGDLIFLTISIAGGPYLGLLGTVIGVMITFATIAKTGEVEVNSIAPGIAGALLATVAGLVVAIPALFAYSYLAARIKETVNTMHLFIDEFVSKMAEFYPPASE